jgi:hypothetical protein
MDRMILLKPSMNSDATFSSRGNMSRWKLSGLPTLSLSITLPIKEPTPTKIQLADRPVFVGRIPQSAPVRYRRQLFIRTFCYLVGIDK